MVYVLAMLGLATFAAWPIYRSSSFLAVAGTATVTGLALALLYRLFWPRPWGIAALALVAYLLFGLTLTMPAWEVGIALAIRGVLAGPVTAWQNLLTVYLPVGGYQNLLVPALLVFLLGALGGMLLVMRRERAALAVPLLLACGLFGLLFGSDATGSSWYFARIHLTSGRETLLGVGGLLISLGWLVWRTQRNRINTKLRPIQDNEADGSPEAKGIRKPVIRVISFAAVLVVALSVGTGLSSVLLTGSRQTLRTGSGPDLRITSAVSPLSQFRTFFGAELYDMVLFSVSTDGPVPERVRLAVLTDFDGQVFSAGAPGAATQFRRVPSVLNAGNGEPTQVRIEGYRLDEFSSLWLPIVGTPERIAFDGPRPIELRNSFYLDRSATSAVTTAYGGMREGDQLVIEARVPPSHEPSELISPGNHPRWSAPEALRHWLEENPVPNTGAGLVEAVNNLRSRGHLSHAVTPDAEQVWIETLSADGYQFVPSAAGHSYGRLDLLFRELNERQQVAGDSAIASLVGAGGNDEQFAAAAALIADQLGFPARVVIGAHLGTDGHTRLDPDIPICAEGLCTGGSMSAWIEVQGIDGRWAPIDVRPQHRQQIVEQVDATRLPEHPTEVRPDIAEEVLPPDSQRAGGGALGTTATTTREDVAAATHWPVFRAIGIGLLIMLALLGPPGVVVLVKVLRRRARRTKANARHQIIGGWEELIDLTTDYRLAEVGTKTRRELAAELNLAGVANLARVTDRAAFSDSIITPGEARQFWEEMADECATIRQGATPWRRLRAELSLTSLLRTRPI